MNDFLILGFLACGALICIATGRHDAATTFTLSALIYCKLCMMEVDNDSKNND